MSIIKNVIKISTIGAGVIYGSKVFKNINITRRVYKRTVNENRKDDQYQKASKFYNAINMGRVSYAEFLDRQKEITYCDAKKLIGDLMYDLNTKRIDTMSLSETGGSLYHTTELKYDLEIRECSYSQKYFPIIDNKICAPMIMVDVDDSRLIIPLFISKNFKEFCIREGLQQYLTIRFLEEIVKIGLFVQFISNRYDFNKIRVENNKEFMITNMNSYRNKFISEIIEKTDFMEVINMAIYNTIYSKIISRLDRNLEIPYYKVCHDIVVRGLLQYYLFDMVAENNSVLKMFYKYIDIDPNKELIDVKSDLCMTFRYMMKHKRMFTLDPLKEIISKGEKAENFTKFENCLYSSNVLCDEKVYDNYKKLKVRVPSILHC